LALLFLMAVGPVLPWHRASGEVLRRRLVGPAWVATAAVVVAVVVGGRDPASLVAFGLGGFAAGTAFRQLVTAVGRNRWGGLVVRTNGGMIVHLGVVLVAVALVASGSYARAGEFRLRPGQSARLAGHTVTYVGMTSASSSRKQVSTARVRIDGGRVYEPALTQFPFSSQAIGTPSVRSRLLDDVYLRLVATPGDPGGAAVIGVIVQPLIIWLWMGGAVMALGTALAGWPRRRRGGRGQRRAVGAGPGVAVDKIDTAALSLLESR
jgi:cytochrome c-type biogenesis protein CcmF